MIVVFVILGFIFMVIFFLAMISGDTKNSRNHSNGRSTPRRNSCRRKHQRRYRDNPFADDRQPMSYINYNDPFDNHAERSFDFQDRDGDGYDDRNDGFWQEREF